MPQPQLVGHYETKCWVPNCRNRGYNKKYIPLPKEPLHREIWVAMAGKKIPTDGETVLFCEDHFKPSTLMKLKHNAGWLGPPTVVPTRNMPESVCRTCMIALGGYESFCVLSAIIPSSIPPEVNTDLIQCRPEPLYQILAFCIPDLNISQDPPSLVCYKCYLNIWMYFVYKITCNKVEKELCGNLPPEQYGKMVLCRSCPQTTGTSFFILSEDSLKGKLLKKMFLNDFPTDVVPLKICLRCWNVLYKLEIFYEQCHATDQKLQRHLLLSRVTSGSLPCSSKEHTENHMAVNYPQDRSVMDFYPPNVTVTTKIYDLTKGEEGTQVSALTKPQNQDKKPKITSFISDVKTVGLTNTWHPPVKNSSEIYTKGDAASNDATRPVSNSVSVIKSVSCTSTWRPPSTIASRNANRTNEMPKDTENIKNVNHKEKPLAEKLSVEKITRGYFSTSERIALVKIMLKHCGEVKVALEHWNIEEFSEETWLKIINEMQQLGYARKGGSLRAMWTRMKKTAMLAASQMGPMTYQDQLVNTFIQKNKDFQRRGTVHVKAGDCEVICLDDDGNDVGEKGSEEIVTDIGDVSGQGPTTSTEAQPPLKNSNQVVATVLLPTKKKRGRPMGSTSKTKLVNTHLSLGIKKKPSKPKLTVTKRHIKAALATTKTRWTYEQKLAFARVIRKEYDQYVTDTAESATARSPWKVILQRLADKGYAGGNFNKLYGLWSAIKKSATIHEKNGLDLVDEEVWDMLQLQCAVRQSLPPSPDGKKSPSSASNNRILPPAQKLKTSVLPATARSTDSGLSPSANNVKKNTANDNSNSTTPDTNNRVSNDALLLKSSIQHDVTDKLEVLYEKGELYNKLPHSDKSRFLDLVEQEIKSMLKNKEANANPWKTICERLQKRVYKDYTCTQVVNLMTQLRRIAGIRKQKKIKAPLIVQNLDAKVFRIQALCLKIGGAKAKRSKDRDAIVWARKAHRKKKIQKNTKEINVRKNIGWSEDEKSALISVIRSYGNQVFKRLEQIQIGFWSKIWGDFVALGYDRTQEALRVQWSTLHKSAKLAWAQQQEATSHDKIIIEFMTEVIEDKEKKAKSEDKEQSCDGSIETEEKGNKNSDEHMQEVDGVDDTFDEEGEMRGSDEEVEMINFEVKDDIVEDAVKEIEESFESKDRQDDDMELSYDYVSIQDIQRDYGIHIVPKNVTSTEVIEIIDSDEE